jgi:hypothetical protein
MNKWISKLMNPFYSEFVSLELLYVSQNITLSLIIPLSPQAIADRTRGKFREIILEDSAKFSQVSDQATVIEPEEI